MRVLVDNIAWSKKEGVDITALPFIDVVDIDWDEVEDQDSFYEVTTAALEAKHKFPCDGFHYQILEGTLH